MSEKILDSKIQMPIKIKNFVARDELLEILKKSTEKVVLLNAGAGYGKTMLLTYYCAETQEKCAWYNLNSLDNDIMTFIKYLSCSMNKVMGGNKYNYNNQYNKSGIELIEYMAYDISYYLSQLADEKITFFLDDFQEINNEAIFNFLSIVLNNTDNNVRFFIATKSSFPKFLARFLLQENVLVLNDKKLVFNKNEVISLLKNVNLTVDVDSCVDSILEYTEGWPAGIIAIALTLTHERKTPSKDEIIALCKESKVYDYFMYEIFKKLPFDIQTFLIHTSVLNVISVALCNAVMNTTTAKSTLDYLVQENMFVVALSGSGNVYRYHSIFKDYLNMQVSENIRLDVTKKAAVYSLNKGDYEQAVEYSIECGDTGLMQSAFELVGTRMVTTGEMLTLNRWIEFLSGSQEQLTGKSKTVIAFYYYIKKDITKALEYIDEACEDFVKEGNENDYVEGILQKTSYLEDQGELSKCLEALKTSLSYIKRKYSANWYIVSEKRMELCLLLINEIEAASIAEEIMNGSVQYIRGGKEAIVTGIKENAELVWKIGKLHISSENIDTEASNNPSSIVYEYYMFCKIKGLYMKEEDEAAYSMVVSYLSQTQTNNAFDAYIKVVGSLLLLHKGNSEEAASLMKDADIYMGQYDMQLPTLRKEDIELLNDTFRFRLNRKSNDRITIKCFDNGLTYVEKQDQEIKWRTKKAYEMFAYLFDRQGKPVSKDTIINVLWPDMPFDKANILFHTTLSYVRKSLSEYNLGDLIFSKSSGYLIDTESISTDYKVLMDIYQKVQAGHLDEIEDAVKLTELYKSAYFDNISSEWVVSRREHLERVFIICCREIAEDMIKKDEFMESTQILSKAIRLDPYSEELSSMIMKAYGAVGDLKNVKYYYDKTKSILKEELDTELSSDTKSLYSEIIHRKK